MEKSNCFVNKYKIIAIIILITLLIGVPFIINILFKIHPTNKIFIAEWGAGDLLNYYGSILLGLITTYLAYVAITQTKYANDMNKRLLIMEESNKKAYLKLNIKDSKIENIENGTKNLALEFENITDNIIVDFKINGSDKLLIDTVFKKNEKNVGGSVVTKLRGSNGDWGIKEDKKFKYNIQIDDLSVFMIVSFEIEIKSIYGLKTLQYFNVLLTRECINTYQTCV